MIKTKRLLITPATVRDLPAFDRLLRDQQLCSAAHLDLPVQPAALRMFSLKMLVKSVRLFKISMRVQPDNAIGLIMLDHCYDNQQNVISGEYELGYLLERSMWGHGIMTEAVHILTKQVTAATTLLAVTDRQNIASQRVLAKNGFYRFQINGGQIVWKYKKRTCIS